MAICLERGADLHMAQLMPLPLTVSCFSKIQIGFTFLVSAHPGSPGQRAIKRVCVCVLATVHDHMIMYVGLLGYSAVVFHVFSCFYILLTVCVVVTRGKSGPALGGTEYRLMPSACRLIVRAKS